MISKFKKAISLYFIFYPRSSKLSEFKDELLGVMMDNYNELVGSGMSEIVAYKTVVATLDNYKETAEEIARLEKADLTSIQRKVFLMAEIVFFTFALALYFIVSVTTQAWSFTWITFIIWACISLIGLFFFILAKISMNSHYIIVRCTILILTTLITTLIYCIVSFVTLEWAVTWVTFIIGLGISYIIDIMYRQHHKVMHFGIFDWLIISMLVNLTVYFGLSFGIIGDPWAWSWVCFIIWIFVASMGIFLILLNRYRKKGMLKGLFSIPIVNKKPDANANAELNSSIGDNDKDNITTKLT